MSCKTSLVPLSRAADVRSLSLSCTDQCGGVRIMQWFWSHLTKTHFWIIFCRMFRIWWYYIKKSVHTVWSPLSFLFYPEMKCRILNHKSSIKCLTPPPISLWQTAMHTADGLKAAHSKDVMIIQILSTFKSWNALDIHITVELFAMTVSRK